MGLLDQPTRWDPSPWKNSNPPDAIDYERPREGFYMSTVPTKISDIAFVEDSNEGWLGDAWKSVKELVGLGDEEEEKAPEPKQEKPEEPKEKKPEKEEKAKKKETEKKPGSLNLSFQSFFSKSHPIIGKLYSGPKDGKMNPELQTAAKAAEDKIASAIGDSGVKGMIWSGSGFATSPADVMGAINAIAKHTGKKSSFLTREERIEAFSSIIFIK